MSLLNSETKERQWLVTVFSKKSTLVCPWAQSMNYQVLQLHCDLVKAAVSFCVTWSERKASGKSTEKTHSGVLAWKIPATEEPGRLPSLGHTESDMTEAT